MADIIRVSISQESVQIVPGESATIEITVQNDSNVVDVFYLSVEGLDPSWYRLSVVQTSLFPSDQTSGTLTITPPKTSAAVSGNYPFSVKASSQKDPSQVTSLDAVLDLQPFYSFEMNVTPQKVEGARGAYKLTINNTGNADLNIDLSGQDPEDLCRFTFDHQRPRVAAGEEFEVAVQVDPGKRPFKGRPRVYRLSLTGTPDPGTAEPVSTLAELDATAKLPGFVGRIFSPFARRRRAPDLRQPTTVERPTGGFPRWAMWAAAAVVAVVILVVVVVIVSSGGSDTIKEDFALEKNGVLRLDFDIPNEDIQRIDAEVTWSLSEDPMELQIKLPDKSILNTQTINSPGGPTFFKVDDGVLEQGVSTWRLVLTNTSDTSQAKGTVKFEFSK